MTVSSDEHHDLVILERIEQDPDATQATLASQLGVAVGTINWHLKRLIAKGCIKVKRAERRKLRYIITPEGLALRARLTVDYIQSSFDLYRLVRQRVMGMLEEINEKGYKQIRLIGDGDVADVCRLTCLENGVEIIGEDNNQNVPTVIIHGLKLFINWEAEKTTAETQPSQER